MEFKVSEDKSKLVVTESFTYSWEYNSVTNRVTVPEGFRFRIGISVRFGSLGLIDLFGPTYSLVVVSAVHDWLYHLHEEEKINIPRHIADEVMRSDKNDPKWLRNIAWFLTRIGGYFVW